MCVEVLSVDADDEGREEQERRDHGELLHDVVLLVRDLAPGGSRATAATRSRAKSRPLDRAQELVVHVARSGADFAREELAPRPAVESVRPSTIPPDGVARRPERPPDVEDVAAQVGEPLADARRGSPVADAVLELVDLVVDGRPGCRGSARRRRRARWYAIVPRRRRRRPARRLLDPARVERVARRAASCGSSTHRSCVSDEPDLLVGRVRSSSGTATGTTRCAERRSRRALRSTGRAARRSGAASSLDHARRAARPASAPELVRRPDRAGRSSCRAPRAASAGAVGSPTVSTSAAARRARRGGDPPARRGSARRRVRAMQPEPAAVTACR